MKYVLTGVVSEAFEHGKDFGVKGKGQLVILCAEQMLYEMDEISIPITKEFRNVIAGNNRIKITIELNP